MTEYADTQHLIHHAEALFPGSVIAITYEDEVIHIDVDGHRYSFEIGSDDDHYVFSDSKTSFIIPLMENPEDFQDLP